MRLQDFQKYSNPLAVVMMGSTLITQCENYKKDIGKNHRFFTEEKLLVIEKEHGEKDGLTFDEIKDMLLSKKGIRLNQYTFKKYVQLQILPRLSGRIKDVPKENKKEGIDKGKNKLVSKGVYSVDVIRRINFIKYALEAGRDKDINSLLRIPVKSTTDSVFYRPVIPEFVDQ